MRTLSTPDVTGFPDFDFHEQVVEVSDPSCGLHAFIAVHSTTLGPSLGGCRIFPYASREAAITDALRLSRGMTYKSALAGLPLGGGKSVIIADPRTQKTEALMESFGAAIENLKGAYITAEDVGSTEHDMAVIARRTSYVCGLPGVSGVGGNPSPYTAHGVFSGIRAALAHKLGTSSLAGRTVAIQGLGAVGFDLARKLHAAHAKLVVCDPNADRILQAKAELAGITSVDVDTIYDVPCDVFAPCALGAVVNDATLPRLKAAIVAGGANNQLADIVRHDQALKDRNILYAPDYVLNSGGVTLVGYEYFNTSGRNPFPYALTEDAVMDHIGRIEQTLGRVFAFAESEHMPTGRAADRLAENLFRVNRQTA